MKFFIIKKYFCETLRNILLSYILFFSRSKNNGSTSFYKAHRVTPLKASYLQVTSELFAKKLTQITDTSCYGKTIKAFGDKEDFIYREKYNLWVYIKCNNLHYLDHKYPSGNDNL